MRLLARSVLIGWLVAAAVLIFVSAPRIADLRFPDPDDAMRLAQVQDLLAGQSWWDVGQHRLDGGAFAMHWSRLVDLPLAAVLWLASPLFGKPAAMRIAAVVVPMLTLLAVMALGALLTRRLAGDAAARQSVLLAGLSVPLLYQLQPLRIDHHGWQVVMALAAVAALTGSATARGGAVAGACLAALLTISLEGLPIAAATVAVALLAWVLDGARRPQALALVAVLPTAVLLLHLLTRGPGALAPACDAIAPTWVAGLALACGSAALTILAAPARPVLRLAGLTAAGALGVATIRLGAPMCAAGPFATLDPLVRAFWYRNVSEGLPVWDQIPSWAVATVGLPIAGLAGALLAWREAGNREAQTRWLMTLLISGAAFALSILVMRAGATANALALPGAAFLLDRLLTRTRAIAAPFRRTLATAVALLLASPGLAAAAVLGMMTRPAALQTVSMPRPADCRLSEDLARLNLLSPATLFAPIDITPAILARSHHSAIAGGYHRNDAAMHRVIAGFLAPPGRARAIVAATGARYVVGCAGENETQLYARKAPNGLWARLERGEPVAWLTRVALPDSNVLVWKVIDPSQRPKRPLS